MTADDLRKAEAATTAPSARSNAKRDARDELVRSAIAEGWTHARIAEATGLTRGRINQIARARR
jgi:hypothetical protein